MKVTVTTRDLGTINDQRSVVIIAGTAADQRVGSPVTTGGCELWAASMASFDPGQVAPDIVR